MFTRKATLVILENGELTTVIIDWTEKELKRVLGGKVNFGPRINQLEQAGISMMYNSLVPKKAKKPSMIIVNSIGQEKKYYGKIVFRVSDSTKLYTTACSFEDYMFGVFCAFSQWNVEKKYNILKMQEYGNRIVKHAI